MSANDGLREHLGTVLQHLPPVQFAFAYGSGVFRQPGLYDRSSDKANAPMIDFMFAVQDPERWHAENIERNAHHYSFLRRLGPRAVVCNSTQLGTGVHFNMAVRIREFVCKYGVVGLSALQDDLTTWQRMYVSGRLQKPVLTLVPCPSLESALQHNLLSAATDFFRVVCGLSYLGDIRVGLAEDFRKVQRLVQGSWHGLNAMYMPILKGPLSETAGLQAKAPQEWSQSESKQKLTSLISHLPTAVLERMQAKCYMSSNMASEAGRREVATAVIGTGRHRQLVRSAIASIVRSSSRRQALAGMFQAGGVRSAMYLWEKLRKAWRR